MQDIIGDALLDYWKGNYTEDLITETNISEADTLSLPYLFRDYKDMPAIEQIALKACRGSVLDIGCGAGSHSLWLQKQGLEVTGLDSSVGAVQVARARGVQQVVQSILLDFGGATFDTLLLLMNGTGIFGTLEATPAYLAHLKKLLNPNGQILIDSSDLQYMYDQNEDGSIWVPSDRYYGELDFIVSYKGQESELFPWLYIDAQRFEALANEAGFNFEILAEGTHFDYVARLTVRDHS